MRAESEETSSYKPLWTATEGLSSLESLWEILSRNIATRQSIAVRTIPSTELAINQGRKKSFN